MVAESRSGADGHVKHLQRGISQHPPVGATNSPITLHQTVHVHHVCVSRIGVRLDPHIQHGSRCACGLRVDHQPSPKSAGKGARLDHRTLTTTRYRLGGGSMRSHRGPAVAAQRKEPNSPTFAFPSTSSFFKYPSTRPPWLGRRALWAVPGGRWRTRAGLPSRCR